MQGAAVRPPGAALKTLTTSRDRFERNARAGFACDAVTERVDDTCDFVTRLESVHVTHHAVIDVQVGATNADGADGNPHPARRRFRHFLVDDAEHPRTGKTAAFIDASPYAFTRW